MKMLVIGDTHYDNPYKGYLECQLTATLESVYEHKPKYVLFLGDIFHHRKPHPEVVVKTKQMFQRLARSPGLTRIIILRGNHDSANKSDDGLTVLQAFEWPGSKIQLVTQTELDGDLNMMFIPHYEDETKIHESLSYIPNEKTIIFGHFGYEGSINAAGFFDFTLDKSDFKNRTILGHIHRYTKDGNITILGTPWSTNFGECDYEHHVGLLETAEDEGGDWGELQLKGVSLGPRYYVCPYESLDQMEDEIDDINYFTVLRVLLSKFTEEPTANLRRDLLSRFKTVGYVDLKFQPVLDKKLNDRLSDYDSNVPISDIDDEVIGQYIEEQTTSIPREDLERGLELIKQHNEDQND